MQNWIEKLGFSSSTASMVVWVGLSVFLLVIVLALAVWLVRTLRSSLHMGGSHGRGGRPQRLAITDAFTLDREGRKLVIVRRDNVEHLLLIGGPNDVLVEPNIVRGERALRDRGTRGGSDAETLQAETALTAELARAEAPILAPAPVPALHPVQQPPAMATIPLPPFRPATPQAPKPVAPAPAPALAPAPARLDDEFERALSAMQAAQRQQAALRSQPSMPAPSAPAPMPVAPATPAAPTAAPDRSSRQEPVSEMARRLNEVLQKPLSGTLRPPFNKPIPPVPATMNSARPFQAPAAAPVTTSAAEDSPAPPSSPAEQAVPAPQTMREASTSAAAPAATPAPPTDTEMDLLEEEMARLLGRAGDSKKPETP